MNRRRWVDGGLVEGGVSAEWQEGDREREKSRERKRTARTGFEEFRSGGRGSRFLHQHFRAVLRSGIGVEQRVDIVVIDRLHDGLVLRIVYFAVV